jgi:hypothetical protein
MSKLAETAIRTTGLGSGDHDHPIRHRHFESRSLGLAAKRLEVFGGPKTVKVSWPGGQEIGEPSRYESDTTASLATSTTLMWR